MKNKFENFRSNIFGPIIFLPFIVLLLNACSPNASNAGENPGGQKQSVSIVRQTKHDFPEKFIAGMRELQELCISGRKEVARAQGWAYDPATDRTTDTEILKLNTKRIEEYFDGTKYAVTEINTQLDAEKMDTVSRELSCKLVPVIVKSMRIEYDSCHFLEINYASKERIEQKLTGKCKTVRPQVDARQLGSAQIVEGTKVQCKWNLALSNSDPTLEMRHCSLMPEPIHAGTGRLLVAEQRAPGIVSQSSAVILGTNHQSLQIYSTTEKAVEVIVGDKISAEKFTAPADSLSFPLTSLN
jgi:hypothetical protein